MSVESDRIEELEEKCRVLVAQWSAQVVRNARLEDALRACLSGGAFKHPQIVERAKAALGEEGT